MLDPLSRVYPVDQCGAFALAQSGVEVMGDSHRESYQYPLRCIHGHLIVSPIICATRVAIRVLPSAAQFRADRRS